MTADLGAELNIGDLHIAIGTLSDEVKELRKRLVSMPDDLQVTGTMTYSTDTSQNYIDLGAPASGKWWNIRALNVGGSDITQSPTGVGWLIIHDGPIMQANPPMFAVKDFTKTALPTNSFYGNRECIALDNQHLYVFITGGANGTQYSATAAVESFSQWIKKI